MGQIIERGADHRAIVPCAHRVVGVGEVDEFRTDLFRPSKERGRVFVIVLVGNLVELPAEPRDVVVEGGIGSVGGDDGIAGFDQQADKIPQKAVNPFAHNDIFRGYTVVCGQRVAQIVAGGVAVFPDVVDCLLHRRDGLGRRPEDVLVGAETGGEGRASFALADLGADKGDRGGQGADDIGIAWAGHAER